MQSDSVRPTRLETQDLQNGFVRVRFRGYEAYLPLSSDSGTRRMRAETFAARACPEGGPWADKIIREVVKATRAA